MVILALVVICSLEIYVSKVAYGREYPEKPIQFLVGLAPGSLTDLSARALAKSASKYLEKQLVVVNTTGAAHTVALNELAKSTPDGYTIALIPSAYRTLIAHTQKAPFDLKVLKILLGYAEFRGVLFVRGDSPYVKMEDLVAYGRKNPGAIKFGHSGRGTAVHIQGALFFKSANVEAIDVPFKGNNEYVVAVIGGHIMAGVVDISGVKEQFLAGTLKPVVFFTNQRFNEWPDVPTSKEKGYADVSAINALIGLCVHKDTPPDRVKKLHDSLKKAIEDPEFRKVLDDMGLKCGYISPQGMEENISEAERIGVPLLKELKLFVQ